MDGTLEHRHGVWTHQHHHHGPHRHAHLPFRSTEASHDHAEGHHGGHGHSHGRIDPSIVRSHAGVRAVAISLAILGVTAALQALVFVLSGSVALLADLIHNAGDTLTALPLGAAFLLRSERGERWSGYAVVLAIFVSALVAGYEAIDRLIHPQTLSYLGAIAVAGLLGFVGNERSPGPSPSRSAPRQPRAARRRRARPRRRVRVTRGDRQRRLRRGGTATRRPDHRAGHDGGDPEDHLGLLAHHPGRQPRPSRPLTAGTGRHRPAASIEPASHHEVGKPLGPEPRSRAGALGSLPR